MGREIELKLAVPDAALLEKIYEDPAFSGSKCAEFAMKTTYFDTADRKLSSHKWMLRQRLENGHTVTCFKMPLGKHARGEWEADAEPLAAALALLAQQEGVPAELKELSAQELFPVCGAEFRRRTRDISFPDGSRAELACDLGTLTGGGQTIPLCEAELELKTGEPEQMQALAAFLCRKYGLHEEPLSKFARAKRLAE